ncbi:hypothetical protein [Anaerococcus vaginimassiliensis]|uniref:hypothetical protein n=1 Tax=Anaerococcus vaginimassiliensis TaxID=2042308 RepID=UPI0010315E3B|nr:hypothetical protein [Anaerococcus vaginimassiliensis]
MTKYEVIKYDSEFRGGEVIGEFTDLEEAKEFDRKERNKILESKEDAFIHFETILEEGER